MAQLLANRWLTYTCLGGVLGMVLGVLFLPLVMVGGFGIGIGLGVGLLQVRALKTLAPDMGARPLRGVAWVAASALGGVVPGWLVAFALIMGASNGGAPVQDALAYISGVSGAVATFGGVSAAVCGGLAGLAQGLALHGSRAGLWPVFGWATASALGWGAAWAAQGGGLGLLLTGSRAGGLLGLVLIVLGALLILAGWAPYAVITGTQLAAPKAALPTSAHS